MIERTTAGTLNIGSEDLAKWDDLGITRDCLGIFLEHLMKGAQQ